MTWETARRELLRLQALVLAEPLQGFNLKQRVEEAMEACDLTAPPIYVVFDEQRSQPAHDRASRALYRAGASGVFEWPRERQALPFLLAELLGMRRARGKTSEPDRALARALRARLRVHHGPANSVRLDVEQGVVSLSGPLARLSDRSQIDDLLSCVPGVKAVSTRGLWVLQSERTDAEIRRDIRRLVKALLAERSGGVDVRVRSGVVHVLLADELRDERRAVRESVSRLAGVRDLCVDVAPGKTARSRATLRQLRRAVALLHPRERIEVQMIDRTVVLAGHVRSLPVKREVEEEVLRHPVVDRAINQLIVRA